MATAKGRSRRRPVRSAIRKVAEAVMTPVTKLFGANGRTTKRSKRTSPARRTTKR